MNARAVSQKATILAENYVSWLRDAGVDTVPEASSINWLEAEPKAEKAEQADKAGLMVPPASPKEPARKAIAPQVKTAKTLLNKGQWPKNLDSLREMMASGAALPGNHYGGKNVAPTGEANAKTMLLLDLPERSDIEAGQLASGKQGILLKNMMAAIGIEISQCHITALSFTRPPTGALPEQDFEILADFVRHQCDLITPKQIILFGSSVSTALLGAELMKARGNLHYFNHNVEKVAALTTFHPRTLLTRPQMKAQVWKDLQILNR